MHSHDNKMTEFTLHNNNKVTHPYSFILFRNNALGVLRVYLHPRGQSLWKGPMHYVHEWQPAPHQDWGWGRRCVCLPCPPKITGTDVKTKDLMSETWQAWRHLQRRSWSPPQLWHWLQQQLPWPWWGWWGGGDDSGKPRAKNHTLVSAMDIVEASGAFMDRNIVGSHVEVVGISESHRGQSCNEHRIWGLQLLEGSYICFRKTQLAWRGGDNEDVLEVFHLNSGIMGCKMGNLPKHLATWADYYDGLCARIVEIYSSDHTRCASVTKRQKYHRGIGCCVATIEGMRDMFVIA